MSDVVEWLGFVDGWGSPNDDAYLDALDEEGPFIWDRLPASERKKYAPKVKP
jgi:hypothetical protein